MTGFKKGNGAYADDTMVLSCKPGFPAGGKRLSRTVNGQYRDCCPGCMHRIFPEMILGINGKE